jgi:aspartate racemase
VLGLAEGGAGLIAIPSVTSHAYRAELSLHVTIPILDLLAVTGNVLARGSYRRPLVLATEATVKLRLLDSAMAPEIRPIYPDEPRQAIISTLIERVKCDGPSEELRDGLFDCIETMAPVTRGTADCVVLGCTELPVIHPTKKTSVPLIDTTDELAKAVLAEYDALVTNYQ